VSLKVEFGRLRGEWREGCTSTASADARLVLDARPRETLQAFTGLMCSKNNLIHGKLVYSFLFRS
jgi:hypothetical protein